MLLYLLSIQMNIRGSIVEVTASGMQVGMHRDSVAKVHLISDSIVDLRRCRVDCSDVGFGMSYECSALWCIYYT